MRNLTGQLRLVRAEARNEERANDFSLCFYAKTFAAFALKNFDAFALPEIISLLYAKIFGRNMLW